MDARLELTLPMTRRSAMRSLLHVFLVALFGFSASVSLLLAQSAGTSAQQVAPAVLPSAPETPAAHALFSNPVAAPQLRDGDSWLWSKSLVDPIHPAPSFGSDFASYGAGLGANSALGFGSSLQATNGFNRIGGTGAWQGGFKLRTTSELFGTAPSGLPSLNQLMRGSYNMPLNASTNTFRFAYHSGFKLGEDFASPAISGLYTTSDLGNGMFLSAGTNLGRSNVGAPAAGTNAAAGKHSATSVGVKLSF